mgnify:CR=1 FL=1
MQKDRHMLNMFVKCFFLLPESVMSDFIQPKTQFSTSSVEDGLNHKVTSSRRAYRAARFLCYNRLFPKAPYKSKIFGTQSGFLIPRSRVINNDRNVKAPVVFIIGCCFGKIFCE